MRLTPTNACWPVACSASRRFFTAIAALVFLSGACASAPWPTEGGERGEVIEVTSLSDQGPGTLREALGRDRPRKIVFNVGGDIVLSKPLLIEDPSVTVAGETAPAPGITILGDKIRIITHDVVLRHVRVRVGEIGSSKPANRDGISIEGGHRDKSPVARILIEHCSVAWAVDEGLSIWGDDTRDVSVRKTIVAETLRNSVHPKGSHSMGLMVGPGARNVLLQQNLLAHNVWRNPVIHGGASAVVVNNLIYNPRYAALHFYEHDGSGATQVSAVGNVVIAGPDTRRVLPALSKGINPGSQIFIDDNVASGTRAFDRSERPFGSVGTNPFVEAPPIWFDDIQVIEAAKVMDTVLEDVGARPWDRDATDKRILEEVRNSTGGIKDRPEDPRLVAPPTFQLPSPLPAIASEPEVPRQGVVPPVSPKRN
jgi:hypothetical protein